MRVSTSLCACLHLSALVSACLRLSVSEFGYLHVVSDNFGPTQQNRTLSDNHARGPRRRPPSSPCRALGTTGYVDSLNPPLVTGGVTYMPVVPCSGRQNSIQLDLNPGLRAHIRSRSP